jgi:hypothetical protein
MASLRPSAPSSPGAHPHRCRRPERPLRDALWQSERYRACAPARRQAELGSERPRRPARDRELPLARGARHRIAAGHERGGLVIMRAADAADRYTPREFFRSRTAPSSPDPQRTARRTCGVNPAHGVRVVQAVALPPGCHPDRRVVTKTWAFRGERARRVKARCSFLPRAGSVAASRPPLRQRPAGTPLLRGLRDANRRRSGQA